MRIIAGNRYARRYRVRNKCGARSPTLPSPPVVQFQSREAARDVWRRYPEFHLSVRSSVPSVCVRRRRTHAMRGGVYLRGTRISKQVCPLRVYREAYKAPDQRAFCTCSRFRFPSNEQAVTTREGGEAGSIRVRRKARGCRQVACGVRPFHIPNAWSHGAYTR